MPVKVFELPGVGPVHIYKRRGSRNIRLGVTSEGRIRITMPVWTPYRAGLLFAEQKQDWLMAQQASRHGLLQTNQRFGKHHTLYFRAKLDIKSPRTRVTETAAYVYHPVTANPAQPALQKAAETVARKALRLEAEKLLPLRLKQLADQYDFGFDSVSVRHLKTRWGSCNVQNHITLNYYLMQLPWPLIDYVLVHELAHTVHLDHSPAFWQTVKLHVPDYKEQRKLLKNYQPSVIRPTATTNID